MKHLKLIKKGGVDINRIDNLMPNLVVDKNQMGQIYGALCGGYEYELCSNGNGGTQVYYSHCNVKIGGTSFCIGKNKID